MANPLGIIRDANSDLNKIDVWALVSGNLVVNAILASYNDILAIRNSYDYLIDISVGGQNTGPGCTYDASHDTFSEPPARIVDYVENLQYDMEGLLSNIHQCLLDIDAGSLDPQQINAAYNSALNDNPDLNNATRTLFLTIYNYIQSGG